MRTRVAAFLIAEAVSAIGNWATLIAIWGYAAYEFDASATQIALFGIAFGLPPVVLGPLAGVAIDRFGSRTVLAAAKALGVVASLALLRAQDFTALGTLAGLHGVSYAFGLPALQALPPRLVADEHLARTNALVALCDEVAIVAGPAVAGLAIGWFGFRGAFVFDAVTYLIGILVLPLVRLRPVPADADAAVPGLSTIWAGWRLVARTPDLRRVVTLTGAVHLLYGAALLVEPLYVRDVLERSPSVFAALQVVFGVFLVAGGIVVARSGDRLVSMEVLVGGVTASAVFAGLYLLTPWVFVAFVGVAGWGLVTAVISGPSRTILQRATTTDLHGRVLAADHVTGSAGELAGVCIAALGVNVLGLRGGVAVLAVAVAVAALRVGVGGTRELRQPTRTGRLSGTSSTNV